MSRVSKSGHAEPDSTHTALILTLSLTCPLPIVGPGSSAPLSEPQWGYGIAPGVFSTPTSMFMLCSGDFSQRSGDGTQLRRGAWAVRKPGRVREQVPPPPTYTQFRCKQDCSDPPRDKASARCCIFAWRQTEAMTKRCRLEKMEKLPVFHLAVGLQAVRAPTQSHPEGLIRRGFWELECCPRFT